MKRIILLTFLFFMSFAAYSQLAQNTSDSPSFRTDKSSIKVFPNPATEYFELTDRTYTVSQINIYNIVGKKMKTFEVEQNKKYYLDQFPKGMYLVQMVSYDNSIVTTQRLNVRKP